jgi:uncharacterized cupin superfamily protein
MESRIGNIANLATARGAYKGFTNPIKPELFEGKRQGRPGKDVNMSQFGVNYVVLEPGSATALRHWHEQEDEFVYVLEGTPTLIDNNGEHQLEAGQFARFPAGEANGHHFINHSKKDVELLVIGSRRPGDDVCHYPDDDLGPIKR